MLTRSNTAAILETYNAEHDNKIDIVYSNGATNESIYDDVMNGRLDAIVATKKTFKNTMKHLAVAMILTKTAISASHRPISCWHRERNSSGMTWILL